MDEKDLLLQTIWEIVKPTSQPLNYPCSIREIILRFPGNWELEQLQALSEEELVHVVNAERVVVYLTQKGLEKVEAIPGPVANDNL